MDEKLQEKYHELDKRIDLLKEEMNTSYERLNASYERLTASHERLRADMAERDAEMAKRDKDNQRWIVGYGIAQIAITIGVLGAGIAFLALILAPSG